MMKFLHFNNAFLKSYLAVVKERENNFILK